MEAMKLFFSDRIRIRNLSNINALVSLKKTKSNQNQNKTNPTKAKRRT